MSARIQKLADNIKALLTGTPTYVRRYQKLVAALGEAESPEYDLVYVLPPSKFHGWILDAICREIDAHCEGRTAAVEYRQQLPPAKAYFYSHYGYLRQTILEQPSVLHARNLLFYTHPRTLWYSRDELSCVMGMADTVISMCSLFVPDLIAHGIPAERVQVALLGADADRFQPHARGSGKIGFCSGYVPRKNGERLLELVRSMPDRSFALCGKKWREWDRFEELVCLPNFEYVDLPYSAYHEFYESIDVFVSVSELEGGPVPLIEAAMCNAVPVCSNTGHAADIITHGENGYLFATSAPVAEIESLIRKALTSTCDVRSTVEHLTWKRFSHQVQEIAGIRNTETQSTESITEAA